MIGKRIRDARLLRGHTQDTLAEALGTSTKQISRYENEANIPSGEVIAKLAMILHVSADYLLGISDIYDPYQGVGLSDKERNAIDAWRRGDNLHAIEVIAGDR